MVKEPNQEHDVNYDTVILLAITLVFFPQTIKTLSVFM